ncbi:MAG: alkaline phosphatase family protein [Alphaproteobacteria bacterium]|nr:alkaline phosphatase family protein [Alphaproteobacteria bacterium]
MADTSRMFIIGLDAADKDLIERWAGDGELPAFRSLMDSSVWGDIENPRGLEAGSCWPTFYFGLTPGETGQFDGARYFDSEHYEHVSFRPDEARRDAIWTTLSKAGKLCGVIDAPYSFPVNDINGIKLVDRGAHVPAGGSDYMDFRTHPAALADEIIERFGEDPANGHSSDFFNVDTAGGIKKFRDLYVERIENKTALALHYWRDRPWDFFLTCFTEAHCVGHRCWHVHDTDHPDHDAAVAAEVGDPVKAIYIALDRAIGRLVEAARGEARVLVYLSHGMGPGYSGTRLLDRILARLDNAPTHTRSGPVMSVARAAWRAMPDAIRRPLKPLRHRVYNDGFQPNRKGRRFFEVFANDRTGGIRINLAGREKHGIVQAGAEYEAVCAQLIADIGELTNAETGTPLAAEITRVRDHYSGDFLDCLPDILVTWNRAHPINAAHSPKIGTLDKTGLMLPRSGDHLPFGRFFGVAPDWPCQRLNDRVRVQDLAPTIAGLFGLDSHASDGVPIAALRAREVAETALRRAEG